MFESYSHYKTQLKRLGDVASPQGVMSAIFFVLYINILTYMNLIQYKKVAKVELTCFRFNFLTSILTHYFDRFSNTRNNLL